MGKNRDRKSLIRSLANTVVHGIVLRNTNRPESKRFLSKEIIEYRGQTTKKEEQHKWNAEDMKYIRENTLKNIKDKLESDYPDVSFGQEEAEKLLDEELDKLDF